MRNFKKMVFVLTVLSFQLLISQEISFSNVLQVTEHDFIGLKNDKVYSWVGVDGNEYAIKKRRDERYTGIKYNGEWVRHGVYYKYQKSYDKPQIEYLRIVANYKYGKLHGEYKVFNVKKGERYLDEVVNYINGI